VEFPCRLTDSTIKEAIHTAWVESFLTGSGIVPSRYPKSWAPRTIKMTYAFHIIKLSQINFSEISWPRLEIDELFDMTGLGSDTIKKILELSVTKEHVCVLI
jgi:hypothetical protein